MPLPQPEVTLNSASKQEGVAIAWFSSQAEAKTHEVRLEFVGEAGPEEKSLEARLKKSKHFLGKKKETSLLRYYQFRGWENVLLLGLGTETKFDREVIRQVGAQLFLEQKAARLAELGVRADSLLNHLPDSEKPAFAEAFVEGYVLASYEFDEFKKPQEDAFVPKGMDLFPLKGPAFKEAVRRGMALARATNFARLLGDRPANVLTPSELAKAAHKMARENGLVCHVLGRRDIEKEKMGLLLGVGQGSAEEPKFIILEYRGGKRTDTAIALVGKGVTFDSGGICLKPSAKMEEMKWDMMGAAVVIAIMQAAAQLKLPVNVTGYVAAAENMPSGSAQRPGDIVRSVSGKTVEIVNTDAEGRLMLADALEYAQKQKLQALIDFATLTGAVSIALGPVATGIMGNHEGLIGRVKSSAEATKERVWELPLYEEYEEDLKSHFADIKNSGSRDAGASKGGVFLKNFVDKKTPWVHCDIASSSTERKDLNYFPSKFAAGPMVRLICHLLENWKPLSA